MDGMLVFSLCASCHRSLGGAVIDSVQSSSLYYYCVGRSLLLTGKTVGRGAAGAVTAATHARDCLSYNDSQRVLYTHASQQKRSRPTSSSFFPPFLTPLSSVFSLALVVDNVGCVFRALWCAIFFVYILAKYLSTLWSVGSLSLFHSLYMYNDICLIELTCGSQFFFFCLD